MRRASIIFAGLAWFCLFSVARALDVLHLKEGDPIPCEILELSDKNVRIKETIKVAGGEAFSTKIVSMETVAFIDFGPQPGETYLLESGGIEDVQELEVLWDAKRSNLHRPNSNAGDVALKLAGMLLAAGDFEGAKTLYVKVEQGDWDEKRQSRARQGRLRTLLAMGEVDAAVKEAMTMAEEGASAEILMDAKYVLASADFETLKELVEDNPKWEEDDLVRPERDQLYHDILDRYLHPHLFHGADEAAASRGLGAAIKVYQWAGEGEAALARAKDMLALYPSSEAAVEASAFLAAMTDPDSNESNEESSESNRNEGNENAE
jgi:hypothetical protein